MTTVSRRRFLQVLGLSTTGAILAACGAAPTTVPATAVPAATTGAVAPTTGAATAVPSAVPATIAPQATATKAAAAAGRTIRIAGGAYGYPSPFAFTRGPGFFPMALQFDQLTWRDQDKLQPWLAKDWKISADSRSYTFTLRDNLKWSDGQPVTADDVIFSADYINKHPIPWTIRLDLIDSSKKIDDQTVEFHLKETYAPFLDNDMASLPIIPKHIWENVSDPAKKQDDQALVGTGAYKLEQYNKEQGAYLFTARNDFILGKPYFQRIEMVPVADTLLSLQKGDIDAGSPDLSTGIADDALAPFKSDPRFGILTAPGETTTALYFNLDKGAPYTDRNFRQALAYAIDRDDLVKRILLGKGSPGNPGWLAPSSPWVNPNVEQYKFDPAKAKSILDSSGYVDKNGTRVTPQGDPLKLELLIASTAPRPGELVRDMLKAVGIDVTLKPVDATALRQQGTAGAYTLALISLGGLGGDPDFIMSLFDSRIGGVQVFNKARGYKNADFEALTDQQRQTLDVAARKALVFKMQDQLAHDVAVLPLFYPDRMFIYNKQLFDNWYFTPGGWAGGNPGPINKAALITGNKTGLTIRAA